MDCSCKMFLATKIQSQRLVKNAQFSSSDNHKNHLHYIGCMLPPNVSTKMEANTSL
jgi:hypothetical protein